MPKPKTGGRKKGTPNKVNATVRQQLDQLWSQTLDLVVANNDIAQLKPADRVDFLMKLTAYILPKPIALPQDQQGNTLAQEIQRLLNIK